MGRKMVMVTMVNASEPEPDIFEIALILCAILAMILASFAVAGVILLLIRGH